MIKQNALPRRAWRTKRAPTSVTPAEAKQVWDSQSTPTARSVALALTQAGRPVHFTTVATWRRRGWRAVAPRPSPLERARARLVAAAPVLTGDPTSTVRDVIKKEGAELSDLSEKDLAAQARRQVLMAAHAVSNKIAQLRVELVSRKPGELAVLIDALARAMHAALPGIDGDESISAASPSEHGDAHVDGLADAIRAWGQVAAAPVASLRKRPNSSSPGIDTIGQSRK